jgi:uncharacterized protein (TIGR03437 family)
MTGILLLLLLSAAAGFARALTTVNAASYRAGGELAPNSIASAFGADLATALVVANSTVLPTQLGNTTVSVTDSQGVAPTQVNFLIPAGTATGAATITVRNGAGATGSRRS